MYLREKKTKTTPVMQLVESYRDHEGNPRQKIILSLGNCNIDKELWQPIVQDVENILNNAQILFPPSKEVREWSEKIVKELQKKESLGQNLNIPSEVTVDPSKITVEEVRELGVELVAKKAYDVLEMDKILEDLDFTATQRRDAAISIINRVCDPVSEHALPVWVNTAAMEELLGDRLDNLGDDRFYRISDKLLSVKEEIEKQLSEKEANLFNVDRSIYLYDLTNTYFEGIMKKNSHAKRGHSKEKRNDAPLISCGMVLDREGFVVRHRVYDGNVGEAGTLKDVVEDLKKECGSKPVVIMDSGISSKENLDMLKNEGFDYITVGKRPSRFAYSEIFENLTTFRALKDRDPGEEVFIKTIETDNEKLVACISEKRAEKEKAILSKAEEKYILDLKKLQKSIEKGKLKDSDKIWRKVGRLAEKHSRIARYYSVAYNENFSWERKDSKYEEAVSMSGGYIIKTSKKDLSDDEIWHLYIMLTKVESGFRALKSDLGLRPIYHQKTDRSEGHIFLTILAYHLLRWIEKSLKLKGKNSSWQSIKRIMQTHSYTTIVIPSKNEGVIRIRKPSVPDVKQEEIYKLLNIDTKSLPITKIIV